MSYPPVGPFAEQLAAERTRLDAQDIQLVEVCRAYDEAAWPHATRVFSKLKDMIAKLVQPRYQVRPHQASNMRPPGPKF